MDAVLIHAGEHARNRLLHACRAISWIGRLALQTSMGRTPVFSIVAAEVQDASAGSGEQAAHVLPGQILIDGKPPWSWAGGTRLKVAWLAQFMVTSPVHVSFNTADSAAESAGLKEAFRHACERAWVDVAGGRRDLTSTFEAFLQDADRAFQKAEDAKRRKRASTARAGEVRASDDRFVESLVLHMYRMHGATAQEASRLFPLTSDAAGPR
jgi:hypothetical protein